MAKQLTFLVFGATGGTGKHFIARALQDNHQVRALVRTPSKLTTSHPCLQIHQGSITDIDKLDSLVKDVDYIVVMLGEKETQQQAQICTPFIKALVPVMRQHGVKRLLYQAGGLSRPYGGQLSPLLWILRNTLARGYIGQHEDNEAVMEYLATQASDIEWIVHRAGINGDGASKGVLERSETTFSVANFRDCAEYSYRVVQDDSAVHTSSFSKYV